MILLAKGSETSMLGCLDGLPLADEIRILTPKACGISWHVTTTHVTPTCHAYKGDGVFLRRSDARAFNWAYWNTSGSRERLQLAPRRVARKVCPAVMNVDTCPDTGRCVYTK